jgi:hypothetical protein
MRESGTETFTFDKNEMFLSLKLAKAARQDTHGGKASLQKHRVHPESFDHTRNKSVLS